MKNTKSGLLLMDALCAGLFSLGAALTVLPAFGLPQAAGVCGGAVLLGLGACALWEWKPWLIPSILCACGLLAGTAAWAMGRLLELVPAAGSYLERAVEESLEGEPRFLLYFGAVLPMTALFWLVMRRLPSLWLVTLLGVGLTGWLAVRPPEGWLLPLLLLLAGMLLFLPRASLKGEGRLQAQLLAAVLAVPVLGLALLLGPRDSGAWRSQAVGHLVQDAQDFWVFHWGELPPLPITTMRSMGLQPQKDSLGGDIHPSDAPVLASSQKLLLRGQVLEVYTGSGWEDAPDTDLGNFRFESVFWQGRRQEAFGLGQPPEISIPPSLLTDVDAQLRSLRSFRSLFLPYRAREVEPGRGGGELFFNTQGEAYWQSRPQAGVEYHVQGRTWNFRDRDFDKNMLLLEQALAGMGPDPLYAQAQERCLALPDTLPDWVWELAGTLTGDSSSPYAKAAALRDYLRENCEYTLTPGPSDPKEDFAAGFLREKKGYCTYYASALTVLCRCAGIPARYVTGYGMTASGKRYQATQATAHAWTEIYLAHTGWVPLDALGEEVFEKEPVREESQTGGAPGRAAVTPPPTPGAPVPLPQAEREPGGPSPLLLLWAVPVVLAATFPLIGKGLRARRYSLSYVQRRFPETERAAEHCCAGLLGLLRLGKLTPRPGETLLDFWKRAAERFGPEEVPGLEEAGRVLDRLRYGEIPPTEEEIAKLCGTWAALRARLRKTTGLVGRFWL